MPGRRTRNLIRVLIGAALVSALVVFAVVPVPDELPAVAIRQPGLYRLEVALLVFYGFLLLITPTFAGLISGRLPIEISTSGARFAEGVDQAAELNETLTKELEQTVRSLTDGLTQTKDEVDRLKKGLGDST